MKRAAALALLCLGLGPPAAGAQAAVPDPPPRARPPRPPSDPCDRMGAPRGTADLHVDLPFQVRWNGRAPDLETPGGDVTGASLRAGCVRLVVLSLFLPNRIFPAGHTPAELESTLRTAEQLVRRNPRSLGPPVRVVYGLEGAQALAGALDRIPALVARGVRLFGPVHAHDDDLADSATDPAPSRGGLTARGERFVRAVYAAGALVDVSHSSDEAFDDVARIAAEVGRPIVATHSNARALTPHPRNLTDDQIRAIARSGGLVGLNFHRAFLRARPDQTTVTVGDVVAHARHIASVAGTAAVLAIGSDLDGEITPPAALATHAGLGTLARALRAAGFADGDVRGVLGENAMRVIP